MGLSELVLCVGALVVGKLRLGLGIDALRTLAFVVVVFGNQATTYANRGRPRLWSTAPSRWLVLSSVIDLSIATAMANRGLAMTPLPVSVLGATLAAALAFCFLVDLLKVPIFRRLHVA
jgi:H+-transporting ATPase